MTAPQGEDGMRNTVITAAKEGPVGYWGCIRVLLRILVSKI